MCLHKGVKLMMRDVDGEELGRSKSQADLVLNVYGSLLHSLTARNRCTGVSYVRLHYMGIYVSHLSVWTLGFMKLQHKS